MSAVCLLRYRFVSGAPRRTAGNSSDDCFVQSAVPPDLTAGVGPSVGVQHCERSQQQALVDSIETRVEATQDG